MVAQVDNHLQDSDMDTGFDSIVFIVTFIGMVLILMLSLIWIVFIVTFISLVRI